MNSQYPFGKVRRVRTRLTSRATKPTPVLSAPQYWLWPQVHKQTTAHLMLQDGNDLRESDLVDLVEYGTLRVVDALSEEDLDGAEQSIDQAFVEAADADDPDTLHGDGHGGAADSEGLPWDAGHDEDGACGAWGSGFDGPGFDEPTGVHELD